MPYIGNNQVAGVHQNNFKILDDISSYTETFAGSSSSVVDTTNNTITVTQSQHRFYHGQRVTYNNGGGGNIGGLTSGTVYYAVADSHDKIKLATSLANALSNTVINITSVGSGSNHTLNSSFDGVSKKFKLTHSGGINVNLTNASHATIAINNVIQRPNLNDSSFTEGFAIEGGNVIVFKTAPISTDTFWGNTIAEAVSTFDTTDHIIDTFTADGVATNFTLSKAPPSIRDIHITLDGVTQHTSAFQLNGNILIFSTAPANGTAIQVKHMGFVGASASAVTSFYGRTGNVALQDGDILRGDGALISGISGGIPGISTTGTSTFNNLSVSGVSTFSNPVSVAATAHFASQQTFFGPVLGNGEISIDILDNTIAATFDYNDTSGLGLFLRSASDMYLLADHKTNTSSNGDGYGLIIQSGSGNIIPSHDYKPQLGLSNREFGTVFASSLDISGNVSIGGVLTYEDVTNVDSVGIITARAGIKVTGGTLNVTNSENTLGILSSTDDGANLDLFDNDTQSRIRTVDGQLQLRADVGNDVADSSIRFFVDDNNEKVRITSGGTVNIGGDYTNTTGKLKVTGNTTIAGSLSASSYEGLKVEEGNRNTSTSLNGTFNVYLSSGHVHTYTAATSGNYLPSLFYDGATTINSMMSDGDVISLTLMVASSSHYLTGLVIEGTTQTIQWVGGSAPSAANGSGYDIYAFTIMSTGGSSFIVIGNTISAA